MKQIKISKLIINKSKFFGHLYQIDKLEEIKEILNSHKKLYKKANHHCYAIKINQEEIAKSDGEVGHPGRILLKTLKQNNLNTHCLIVSRVFGGVKLGPAGVARAFRECARLLLKQ